MHRHGEANPGKERAMDWCVPKRKSNGVIETHRNSVAAHRLAWRRECKA